jgi:hypothetical protein
MSRKELEEILRIFQSFILWKETMEKLGKI